MKALQKFLDWGGTQEGRGLLVLSGLSLLLSIFHPLPLPFDAAWVAIVLCGVPLF